MTLQQRNKMTRYPLFFINLMFAFFSLPVTAAELINVSPDQLAAMQKQNALVVDIRTEQEWAATGTIPDSLRLQAFDQQGKFNEQRWLTALNERKQSPDQPVILVCRSGNRSAKVGNYLTRKLGMDNIYHLKNGITGWLKEARTVQKDCSPEMAC